VNIHAHAAQFFRHLYLRFRIWTLQQRLHKHRQNDSAQPGI